MCDHYAVRLKGQLVCRDCGAESIIDITGQHWKARERRKGKANVC